MPILDVEVVLSDDAMVDSSWAPEIAVAAGRVFGTQPGQTWVRVRKLLRSQYAENGLGHALNVHPVFVSVLVSKWPDIETRRSIIDELTSDIAGIMGRPRENVHILYLPPASERMGFGGTLVE